MPALPGAPRRARTSLAAALGVAASLAACGGKAESSAAPFAWWEPQTIAVEAPDAENDETLREIISSSPVGVAWAERRALVAWLEYAPERRVSRVWWSTLGGEGWTVPRRIEDLAIEGWVDLSLRRSPSGDAWLLSCPASLGDQTDAGDHPFKSACWVSRFDGRQFAPSHELEASLRLGTPTRERRFRSPALAVLPDRRAMVAQHGRFAIVDDAGVATVGDLPRPHDNLALAAAGDAVLLAQARGTAIYVSTYEDGEWRESPPYDHGGPEPERLHLAGAGRRAILLANDAAPGIVASFYRDGRWTSFERHAAGVRRGDSLAVGIDERGDATLIWTQARDDRFPARQDPRRVDALERLDDGWSESATLFPPGPLTGQPLLASARDGRRVVAWSRVEADDHVVELTEGDGRWWQAPRVATRGGAWLVDLLSNPDGLPVLVWIEAPRGRAGEPARLRAQVLR